MSLADLALLGPLYAHLYLDAVPGRLLRETAPAVCAWIERMNHPLPKSGTFVAADALARPCGRCSSSSAATPSAPARQRAFEAWADTRPAEMLEPPRAVGSHEAGLRGARFRA
jgi:hypothetical protein